MASSTAELYPSTAPQTAPGGASGPAPPAPWDRADRGAGPLLAGLPETARDQRWSLLRWQWEHSSLPRLRHCHLVPVSAQVWVGRSGAGRAFVGGLQTCASVWSCPLCSAKIRVRRAARIELAAERWLARDGSWLGFLTLTVRHSRGQSLRDLYGALAAAWKSLRESRWWRSLGLFGTIRSAEVTWGANGWHPHLHLLLFRESPLDLAAVGAELSRRWRAAIVAAGLRPTTLQRGARLQVVSSGGGAVGAYLSKVLDDGGREWSVGDELARSDAKRGGKGLAPMQLLEAAASGDRFLAARWHEYEQATFGRRAIEASRGLFEALDVPEELDEELAGEQEPTQLLAVLPPSGYRALAMAGLVPAFLGSAEGDGGDVSVFLAVVRILGGQVVVT